MSCHVGPGGTELEHSLCQHHRVLLCWPAEPSHTWTFLLSCWSLFSSWTCSFFLSCSSSRTLFCSFRKTAMSMAAFSRPISFKGRRGARKRRFKQLKCLREHSAPHCLLLYQLAVFALFPNISPHLRYKANANRPSFLILKLALQAHFLSR